jgi:hypothetical protein
MLDSLLKDLKSDSIEPPPNYPIQSNKHSTKRRRWQPPAPFEELGHNREDLSPSPPSPIRMPGQEQGVQLKPSILPEINAAKKSPPFRQLQLSDLALFDSMQHNNSDSGKNYSSPYVDEFMSVHRPQPGGAAGQQ